MKTVLEHLMSIKDLEVRKKCLENLDPKCADLMCYSPGYALMLGVNQPSSEKKYWDGVYLIVNRGE